MTTPTPGLGDVHVTPEQLNGIAGECTRIADKTTTNLNNLLDSIRSLSGAGLAGQANTALQNSSTQLGEGLNNVVGALNGLAEKITSANTRLGAQDEDAAQLINNAAAGGTADQSVINALRGA